MKNSIWYLVKFFKEEAYADQFINGTLYCNRISYFKLLEQGKTDGRPDHNEAVAAWLRRAAIEFNDHPELNITSKDLAGPITLSFDYHDNLNVFCMTAIHTCEFECTDGLVEYAVDEAFKVRAQLEIDAKCLCFGRFAVVVRACEFVLRAKNAIESRGFGFNSTLVEYFDPESFEGNFSWKAIPFMKSKQFSYQKEYRICVDTKTVNGSPVAIDIGNIQDISGKMFSTEVNTLLKLQPRERAEVS